MEFSKQKELIRTLKPIIEKFEENGVIRSFNYNHYYSDYYATEPKEGDHLAVRVEFSNSEKKKLFEDIFKSLNIEWEEQVYNEKAEIKKAYELGSRLAFLSSDLVERKNISENLLKNKEFQIHMIHGLLNSLGIPSRPDERDIHYILYHHFSERLNLDLKPYIMELNESIPSEEPQYPDKIYKKLRELSRRLCSGDLDKRFPMGTAEGQVISCPPENLIWASTLIATAWLGWIYKSKAIWHYNKEHPEMEMILRNYLIPSVIEAFEQGAIKAKDDKQKK